METMNSTRLSAAASRLSKGDVIRCDGEFLEVQGRPVNHPSGDFDKVHVPVKKLDGGKNTVRRTFKRSARFSLFDRV
jgi:translation elongation factor P/translation initiation factor 5A